MKSNKILQEAFGNAFFSLSFINTIFHNINRFVLCYDDLVHESIHQLIHLIFYFFVKVHLNRFMLMGFQKFST